MSIPQIIIISEPDPMISGVLRVEFSRLDFAVLLAGSSEEAEAYASQTVASMLVMDACKTPLAAFQACARVRRCSGYAARPIVLTIQEVSERTRAAAQTAGATVLLAKPYSMTDLFSAIRPHLPANDPLLVASNIKPGSDVAVTQEWKAGAAKEWRSDNDSTLSRNKFLLPIVRGAGKKIPLYRIS